MLGWLTRSSFVSDLRQVLREHNFRRLFATRLVSQAGDGIFTAGIGTYVFFNATTFTSPTAGAAIFTVVYLPYSLIGPFAGVFIDRWSRRQILFVSALIRSVLVVATAALMAVGTRGVALYIAVLLVLGVNRFFLASLSAALPHVVARDKLVMANSVSPTAGGIMAAIGGILALGLNAATGDTERGAAVTLLAAGACYVIAGLVAATMARDLLGPSREAGRAAGQSGRRAATRRRRPGPGRPLRTAPPRAGQRPGRHRRGQPLVRDPDLDVRPAVPELLLCFQRPGGRGALHGAGDPGGGWLRLRRADHPPVTRRLTKPATIALLFAAGAVVTGVLGETFAQGAFLAIGFCLYLIRQGVAICATTILQEEVADAYRGRVFSFYDMTFNVTYVLGAALAAGFMPVTGRSPVIIGVVAAGYAVTAGGYWLLSRHSVPDAGEPGPASPSPSPQRSSS